MSDETSMRRRESKVAVMGLRPFQLLLVLATVAAFAVLIALGVLSPHGPGPPGTYVPGSPFRNSQPPK